MRKIAGLAHDRKMDENKRVVLLIHIASGRPYWSLQISRFLVNPVSCVTMIMAETNRIFHCTRVLHKNT
jgi:hypothetical protein